MVNRTSSPRIYLAILLVSSFSRRHSLLLILYKKEFTPMAKFSPIRLLAAIHSFPALIAAHEGLSIIESFDQLRGDLPKILGYLGHSSDWSGHVDWINLSSVAKTALKETFPDLSNEQVPDLSFWCCDKPRHKNIYTAPEFARLKEFANAMVTKYGQEIDFMPFSNKIFDEASAIQRPKNTIYVTKDGLTRKQQLQ